MLYGAIVFLPLAASIIAGFFGRLIGDRASELVTCLAVTLSAVFSVIAYINVVVQGSAVQVPLFTWIESGEFQVLWSIRVDELTAVMLIVVTFISAAVHWYSIGYMAHDNAKPRFFAYLSLFTFAMLMLVTADNFVQLYFGWEGVGLCSYFLIGFWYDRPSANAAAIKAFVVNRIGDFGFALGIMAIFFVFDSVSFDVVFGAAPGVAGQGFNFLGAEFDILTVITLLLFLGAMGKSAQLGLHTWLPDAMEGPTPVSALIHAATMVTAGVFMVVRCSPLFEYAPFTLGVGRHHRRVDRDRDGLHRPGAERHQARYRLFDVQPARLHVLRHRCVGLQRGDLSSLHPRILQGASVSRRRIGHPRPRR